MPYTVQFEVGSKDDCDLDDLKRANAIRVNLKLQSMDDANIIKGSFTSNSYSTSGTPASGSSTPLSIMETLASNSIIGTPASPSPSQQHTFLKENQRTESATNIKEFFYNNQKFRRASTDPAQSVVDKLGPQYIQPRSRFNSHTPPFPKSVVDAKRTNDDLGLPSMKINRSSGNLAGSIPTSASNSQTNLSLLNPSSVTPRKRSSLGRHATFTLHSGGSSNSLAIAEEQEAEDPKSTITWNENVSFNEIAHARTEARLAPFGGFSNPDIKGALFNQTNLFENAKWSVVFTGKGNVSVRKAVKLAVGSGIIESCKWVGTIAMPSDDVPQLVIDNIARALSADYDCDAVFPNDLTFDGHYNSFCKQILWPTMHYQIPDDPKLKAFEDHSWGHYQLLNQLVANKIVKIYQRENGDADPNDPQNMIWIQDYHLLLVPRMVREQLPNAKIGLFLHVSFPSSEVFRCFAARVEILKGMLGANCISFQTEEYVRHFLQTCNRLLLADINDLGITFEGNFTMTNTIPVGIDSKSFEEVVQSEEVTEWRQLIRERWCNQHLILSRDKLDKLRGIKQKFLAYEIFLKNNPEFIDNTVLIQICSTSNDPDYESEILQIVDRINSLSEDISLSQPVVLLQKDIEFEQYVALQCEAELFVVSSMREGLNLTCHEFITATSEKKSPLLLSEFTGSSDLLECNGKGAILINPWAVQAFSEAFYKLLTMSKAEKVERWYNCHEIVLTRDSTNWVINCLQSINDSWERNQRRNVNTLIRLTKQEYNKFYNNTKDGTRLYFLNLETPVAASSGADHKILTGNASATGKSPHMVASLISDLLYDSQNQVYLISFAGRNELDRLYRRYPNLGLIAENGGYIKLIGSSCWVSIVDEAESLSWMPQATLLIQSKVERLPGSFCHIEDCSITFHAGKSFIDNHERSLDAMGDCIEHINVLFQEQDGIHATLIRNMVVVQQDQLALKALTFITEYYNHSKKGVEPEALIAEYKVKPVPGTPTGTNESAVLPTVWPLKENKVSAVFIGGGSTPTDEPSYEFVNKLKEDGEVGEVVTVVMLGTDPDVRTSANQYVNGKNELLRLLSNTGL